MSKSPFHSFLVIHLARLLQPFVPKGLHLRTEQPVTCGDSEPEPDLALVEGSELDYRHNHPHSAELVIEVCVTSQENDRSKLPTYATAEVKELWLLLEPEKQVEVYQRPEDGRFAEFKAYGPGGKDSRTVLPAFVVDLDALFANES